MPCWQNGVICSAGAGALGCLAWREGELLKARGL